MFPNPVFEEPKAQPPVRGLLLLPKAEVVVLLLLLLPNAELVFEEPKMPPPEPDPKALLVDVF